MQPCLFCGGDASAADHLLHCDGRQGLVEELLERAAIDAEADDQRDIPGVEAIERQRETSSRAFYNAIASGVITTRRQQIYVALQVLGQSTANEAIRYVQREYRVIADSHSFTPRFSELRDAGYIREVGERVCSVTSETCVVWEAIPADAYIPMDVVKHRCPECGQIVSREVSANGTH